MIDDLRHMAVYVAVIEAGSFSAAARDLKLSPSVISHHISQLEGRHNVVLLRRSTRKLNPTDIGMDFYRHAKTMVEAAAAGLGALQDRSDVLRGKICLSIPAALSKSIYTRRLADFLLVHSEVQLDLRYSDSRVDLIDDGVDLAIRLGAMPDSSMRIKKLGQISRNIVCTPECASRMSPDYLAVSRPQQIQDWPWIQMRMMSSKRCFRHPILGNSEIETQYRVEVDNVYAMYQLCLHGAGLATPPMDMVREDIKAGRLVDMLPDWRPEDIDIHAIWLPRMGEDSLIMAVLDALGNG